MTETLMLEIGKQYISSDGLVTSPLEYREGCTYCFSDPVSTRSYTEKGLYVEDCVDSKDLVEEYKAIEIFSSAAETPDITSSDTGIVPEIGKRYITAEGLITSPLEYNKGHVYCFSDPISERSYTEKGLFVEGHVNSKDLVEEYKAIEIFSSAVETPDITSSDTGIVLEIGKRYVTRVGNVTAPLENSSTTNFPFVDPNTSHTYKANGHCLINDCVCKVDIVKECLEFMKKDEKASSDTGIVLEIGKQYVTRVGNVTAPLENSSTTNFPFVNPDTLHTYKANGRYLISEGTCGIDIVEEYLEFMKKDEKAGVEEVVLRVFADIIPAYKLLDKVRVTLFGLNYEGRVIAYTYDGQYLKYTVQYASEGSIEVIDLLAGDLELLIFK